MNDINARINEMFSDLKQQRDELQVKLHLAKLDAGDEWDKLETKLAKLETKVKQVGNVTAEASQDIGAAAKLLGEEIRDGFKKISKQL